MKNAYEDENILSLEDIQKIKIIKIYDYVRDNKKKIEENNYALTPIARSFGLTKIEVVSYLKNVCELSQKLETSDVCITLNAVKEKMEEESKNKKPTVSELQFKQTLNDERIKKIDLGSSSLVENNESSITNTYEKLYMEQEEETNEHNSLYASLDDNNVEEVVISNPHKEEDEDIQDENLKNHTVESHLNSEGKFVHADDDIEIVDEETIQKQRLKELVTNDVDYKDEDKKIKIPNLNNNSPKKKSNKFIVIGSSVFLMTVGLFGAFMFVTKGGHDSQKVQISTQIQTPQPVVNQATIGENPLEANSINNIAEIKSPIAPIKMPIQESVISPIEQKQQNEPIMNFADEESPAVYKEEAVNSQESERIKQLEEQLKNVMELVKNNQATIQSQQINTNNSVQNSSKNTNTPEVEAVSFLDINSFSKEIKRFKFNGASFEYKGQTFKEGDELGNIRIEAIVPKGYMEFSEISTNTLRTVKIR